MTVSRKHAQITFSEGHYFIEPLAEHNPVFLNNKEIPLNNKREIKNHDRLAVGRHKITMIFETQRASASRMDEPKFQAASKLPPTSVVPQEVGTPDDRTVSPPSTDMNPLTCLIVEVSSTPEKVDQRIEINQYPFLLGRTLPLLGDEIEISRKHAEISYDLGRNKFFITDLKSTNGVSVDGVQIRPEKPAEIKAGSRIGLGKVVVLRFQG
jgi:pSer/pThr/pTyr-binding forkhead associated (FHA) protein